VREPNQRRGALLVRHGKGGRRREVGMDGWGWQQPRHHVDLSPGIDNAEIIGTVNARRAPMIPVSASSLR